MWSLRHLPGISCFSGNSFHRFGFLLSDHAFLLRCSLTFLLRQNFRMFLHGFRDSLRCSFRLHLRFCGICLHAFIIQTIQVVCHIRFRTLYLLRYFFQPVCQNLQQLISKLTHGLCLYWCAFCSGQTLWKLLNQCIQFPCNRLTVIHIIFKLGGIFYSNRYSKLLHLYQRLYINPRICIDQPCHLLQTLPVNRHLFFHHPVNHGQILRLCGKSRCGKRLHQRIICACPVNCKRPDGNLRAIVGLYLEKHGFPFHKGNLSVQPCHHLLPSGKRKRHAAIFNGSDRPLKNISFCQRPQRGHKIFHTFRPGQRLRT